MHGISFSKRRLQVVKLTNKRRENMQECQGYYKVVLLLDQIRMKCLYL